MIVVDNICAFALIYSVYFIVCCIILYQFSSFVLAIAFTIIQAFYSIAITGGCFSYTLIINNHLTQTIIIPLYEIVYFSTSALYSNYFAILNTLLENESVKSLFEFEIAFVSITGLYLLYKVAGISYAFYKILTMKTLIQEFFYNEECSFCVSSLNQQYDEIEILKCKHAFHTSCMSKYIIFHNSEQSKYFKKQDAKLNCPICRTPLHQVEHCGA